jgi:hypothetical protein
MNVLSVPNTAPRCAKVGGPPIETIRENTPLRPPNTTTATVDTATTVQPTMKTQSTTAAHRTLLAVEVEPTSLDDDKNIDDGLDEERRCFLLGLLDQL